jgi:hypothetical protein
MRKYILIFLIFWLADSHLKSQQNPYVNNPTIFQPNILPPSPEAYKLGSYGNIPVGMFTGTPNIDIPIMNYGTDRNDVSIKINYSSGGIRVDEASGLSGLGWKFSAGGVITRVIRGIADEKSNPNTDFKNPPDLDSLQVEDNAVRTYLQAVSSGFVDSEPDIYYASFGSNSFSFVFDKRGYPIILSQRNVQIEKEGITTGFVITLEDGAKYYFDEKEITSNSTVGAGHSIPKTNVSSWYLTKIVDMQGIEIYFEYEERVYYTILSTSQTLTTTVPGATFAVLDDHGNCTNGFSLPPKMSSPMNNLQNVRGKRLKRIYSNNAVLGEIILSYNQLLEDEIGQVSQITKSVGPTVIESYVLTYSKTLNDRVFLSEITETKSGKKHIFEYTDSPGVPKRLSYSRDMYGYYNGKDNLVLVPKVDDFIIQYLTYNGADQSVDETKAKKGLLRKIIYPTKGYTLLDYESNTVGGKRIITPPMTAAQLQVNRMLLNSPNNKVTDETVIDNKRAQFMRVVLNSGYNDACEGISADTGNHHVAGFWAVDQNNQPVQPFGGSNCPGFGNLPAPIPGNSSSCYYVEKGKKIKFTLEANFRCTIGSLNVNYIPEEDQEVADNIPVGGLRIKEISSYDTTGSQPIIKKYNYNTGEFGMSSGIQVEKPYFIDRSTSGNFCILSNASISEFPFINISSDNFRTLYPSHPAFFYKSVMESVGTDGGYTLHEFSTHTDYFGKNIQGVDIRSSQWTNFGWNNGRELVSNYYDKNNNVVKKIINEYEQDNSKKYSVRGLTVRMDYEPPLIMPIPTRACTNEDIKLKYTETDCLTAHSHTFYNGKCIAQGASNVDRTVYDECYGKPVGTIFTHSEIVNNLSINQYENISYFSYLKSQKTTDYLAGKEVKTETQYFYNNPAHLQLTAQKTTHPDSSINEVSYKYAYEKGNQLMIGKNMVGIPLETTATQSIGTSSKILSKTETIYPASLPNAATGNLVLPLSFNSYDTLNTSLSSTDVTYNAYDNKGNILQYTTKEGTPVSIVWGYNQTQPIIKVEGIQYSQLLNYISGIVAHSDSDALDPTQEPGLIQAYERFRKDPLVADKLVTTYTYDPLIGVTNITPPSGIREIYVYDASNRLKEVKMREKDSTGNYVYKTVKEFKYNYKP